MHKYSITHIKCQDYSTSTQRFTTTMPRYISVFANVSFAFSSWRVPRKRKTSARYVLSIIMKMTFIMLWANRAAADSSLIPQSANSLSLVEMYYEAKKKSIAPWLCLQNSILTNTSVRITRRRINNIRLWAAQDNPQWAEQEAFSSSLLLLLHKIVRDGMREEKEEVKSLNLLKTSVLCKCWCIQWRASELSSALRMVPVAKNATPTRGCDATDTMSWRAHNPPWGATQLKLTSGHRKCAHLLFHLMNKNLLQLTFFVCCYVPKSQHEQREWCVLFKLRCTWWVNACECEVRVLTDQ